MKIINKKIVGVKIIKKMWCIIKKINVDNTKVSKNGESANSNHSLLKNIIHKNIAKVLRKRLLNIEYTDVNMSGEIPASYI